MTSLDQRHCRFKIPVFIDCGARDTLSNLTGMVSAIVVGEGSCSITREPSLRTRQFGTRHWSLDKALLSVCLRLWKPWLSMEYNVHIWQVSPQLSAAATPVKYERYSKYITGFCANPQFLYINKGSLTYPHLWRNSSRHLLATAQVGIIFVTPDHRISNPIVTWLTKFHTEYN